jgi:predicted acylesterase/phospholipase RssA
MRAISSALSILKWLFVRLPLGFSVPFSVASLCWVLFGFKYLNALIATPAAHAGAAFLQSHLSAAVSGALIDNLGEFLHAVLVIALFALGFIVSYNLSALINWLLFRANLKPAAFATGAPVVLEAAAPSVKFADVKRIGIVLAGGGAKGAFQAGAMQAIYSFLRENGALDKVAVISGTSIGSWNGLFWLADLIESADKGPGIHERWWRSISIRALAAPSWYVPFLRSAFLSTAPWRRAFDQLFDRPEVREHLAASKIHFYFTYSEVRRGRLRCTTNNPHPPPIHRVEYEHPAGHGDSAFIEGLKEGVFASMDLPPLFPFVRRGSMECEDGGVIDNLPVLFPASDGCDLIFVLPLNADFDAQPNRTSVLARLFRVMDVRQGALERHGFKLIYLYNELAALREHFRAQPQPPQPQAASSDLLSQSLARRNRVVSVFAICPSRQFVAETLNTQELWKHREAGTAFEVMQRATRKELQSFDFQRRDDKIRVKIVKPTGDVLLDEHF